MSRFWKPLLEASWELLGLSWGPLGPLLGTLGDPKWCPRGEVTLTLAHFFCNLNLHHLFFLIFAASWCLWGLSWERFGPFGASLGREFGPLEPNFSRIIKEIVWIFSLVSLFALSTLSTLHIHPLVPQPPHPFHPFYPLTSFSPARRNARSDPPPSSAGVAC